MDSIDQKIVKRAYEPYRKEAMHCFLEYILVVLVCGVVFLIWRIQNPNIYIVVGIGCLLFFVLEIFLDYRLALLSWIEEHWRLYDIKEVQMVRIKVEYSPSGKYESIIPKLYPKELGVNRNKIKCIDFDNKKFSLRSAMGNKNAQILIDEINKKTGVRRTVKVGKYTHIIVKYCDNDYISHRLNTRL